jgi:bifunctional pyridoxal-dependent enzyme with beta-cystathionase and maltose regulon repressor activities
MQNNHSKFVRVPNSTKWQGMPPEDHVFTLADMDVPLDPGMRKAIMAKL